MAKAKKASNTLHVGVVMDRSGSMGAVWRPAIEGINDYIQQLQEDPDADTTFVTFAAFDHEFDIVHDNCRVAEIPEYTGNEFPPRGDTALNDAIADMIETMDGKVGDDKVMIVVLTDGQENRSVRYAPDNRHKSTRSSELIALVKKYEDRGNWTFVYLGANDPDVYETAAGVGIAAGNTAMYSSTPTGYRNASATLASVTRTRKSSIMGQSVAAFDDAGESQDITDEAVGVYEPKLKKKGSVTKGSLTDNLGA